jgi:hypothetical protein
MERAMDLKFLRGRSGLVPVWLALIGLGVMPAAPASAVVKKMVAICPGKVCAWYLPELPELDGWITESTASDANEVAVLVPTGKDFSSAAAVIYARAYLNLEKTTIQSRAATSNEKWSATVKGVKIDRLPDVARAKGGVPFEIFHYRNPHNKQQKSELVALAKIPIRTEASMVSRSCSAPRAKMT